MLRAISGIVTAGSILTASTAAACAHFPEPIGFRSGQASLAPEGSKTLRAAVNDLKTSQSDYMICIGVVNRTRIPARQVTARIATAKRYLLGAAVPPSRIRVIDVSAKQGILAGEWIGRGFHLTVEVTPACDTSA